VLWNELVTSTLRNVNNTNGKVGKVFPRIIGSDRDAGVVIAARENSKRSGVEDMVEFFNCSISSNTWFNEQETNATQENGCVLVATNPPFGKRISKNNNKARKDIHPLLSLYQTLGKYATKRLHSSVQLSLIAHDFRLARKIGVDSSIMLLFATAHGGLNIGAFTTGQLSDKMLKRHNQHTFHSRNS
jgi:23S rRNA G2445 N2-methylase RlmL